MPALGTFILPASVDSWPSATPLRPKTEEFLGSPDTPQNRAMLEIAASEVSQDILQRTQAALSPGVVEQVFNENGDHIADATSYGNIRIQPLGEIGGEQIGFSYPTGRMVSYSNAVTANIESVQFTGNSLYNYNLDTSVTMWGGTELTVNPNPILGGKYTTIDYSNPRNTKKVSVKMKAHLSNLLYPGVKEVIEQSLKVQAARLISSYLPPEKIEAAFVTEADFITEAAFITEEEVCNLKLKQYNRTRIAPEALLLREKTEELDVTTYTFEYEYLDTVIHTSVSPEFIQKINEEYRAKVLRDQMRRNMLPVIHEHLKKNSRKPLPLTALQANEVKARETLRDMLLESEWRRYLTNGFIMVKAQSGLWYQVFKGDRPERIRVYKDNKHIETLCIHTTEECPPTDHVINMKILLEIDEQAVRNGANISKPSSIDSPIRNHLTFHVARGTLTQTEVDNASTKTRALKNSSESLVSIYKRLKASA